MSARRVKRRRDLRSAGAFTLVELLVVIGIIAILIALLFPVLRKIRQAAERTACGSNMRQVAVAFLAYANDNKGWFPAPSRLGNPASPHYYDWLYFQKGRNITQSRLWPYLGKSDKVLRCPSGLVSINREVYPYSYAVNDWITGDRWDIAEGMVDLTWASPMPCRLTRVKRSCEVLLVVEPASDIIFDGMWEAKSERVAPDGKAHLSYLSIRHTGFPDSEAVLRQDTVRWVVKSLIHAVCADGHYVQMTGADAELPRHFDPNWIGPAG